MNKLISKQRVLVMGILLFILLRIDAVRTEYGTW